MQRYLTLFLAPSVLLILVTGLVGQEKETVERGQPSRYFLGQEEQMLLPVNILGMVQKPGQYMVPFRTDLISLIAYAGGFREDAKIDEIKIVRNVTPTGKGNGSHRSGARVFRVDIRKYFEGGDVTQIPQLMPDDTVIVSGTAAQKVSKVFEFISNIAIIGQLAFYVVVVLDRT